MKQLFLSLFALVTLSACATQQTTSTFKEDPLASDNSKPKLVVGIVVDQMRYDYLMRFYDKYSDDGFKRLLNEGFNCKNGHFNYVPTYTGPGHASVYTGTSPKYHGIIANDWYDKELDHSVYCAGDTNYQTIGSSSKAGEMSPHRMQTTTFGDENRLFTQMRGKTIGIALKDRGAILPAGHTANAAYWFDGDSQDEGNWITSTFYMETLPNWVQKFNDSGLATSYLKEWNTLYDIATYTESGSDDNNFEGGFKGKERPTFPYDLKALKADNKGYDLLKATPYGNSLTTDFAIAALKGEQLGQDDITDVLAVSYSGTDYVGHNFGVNSKEVQDTYLRLDLDLARLFAELDATVGKGEYTVFLTADHAGVDVPAYLQSVGIPAGYFDRKAFSEKLKGFMKTQFKQDDLIANISNNQIFLNRKKIEALGLKLSDVQEIVANEIISYTHIDKVYTASAMTKGSFTTGIESLIQNGHHQKRSGDVMYMYEPAVLSYSKTGSSHGTGLNYDTHVPMLFYGKGIKKGESLKKTTITDIAPTMSALLGISFPSGSTGQPLEFVLEK